MGGSVYLLYSHSLYLGSKKKIYLTLNVFYIEKTPLRNKAMNWFMQKYVGICHKNKLESGWLEMTCTAYFPDLVPEPLTSSAQTWQLWLPPLLNSPWLQGFTQTFCWFYWLQLLNCCMRPMSSVEAASWKINEIIKSLCFSSWFRMKWAVTYQMLSSPASPKVTLTWYAQDK